MKQAVMKIQSTNQRRRSVKMQAVLTRIKARRGRQGLWLVPLVIAVAISLFLAVRTEQFLSSENLLNLVAQCGHFLLQRF